MTVIRKNNQKVLLPRLEGEDFWEMIHKHYARQDAQKWKGLAILALRENAGWPLDKIGSVFGHHKGHVSRILTNVKQELRDCFEQSPEWLCMPDQDDFPNLDKPEKSINHGDTELPARQCRNQTGI